MLLSIILFALREYIIGIVQIFVAKCTLTFNIAHSHHTIYMDHHYIYIYMLTLASIHSQKDASTLHTTHTYTSAITNTHTHTTIFACIIATCTCIWSKLDSCLAKIAELMINTCTVGWWLEVMKFSHLKETVLPCLEYILFNILTMTHCHSFPSG